MILLLLGQGPHPSPRVLGRAFKGPGLGKGPSGTRALSRGRGLEEEPRAVWGGEGEGGGGGEGSRQTSPKQAWEQGGGAKRPVLWVEKGESGGQRSRRGSSACGGSEGS